MRRINQWRMEGAPMDVQTLARFRARGQLANESDPRLRVIGSSSTLDDGIPTASFLKWWWSILALEPCGSSSLLDSCM